MTIEEFRELNSRYLHTQYFIQFNEDLVPSFNKDEIAQAGGIFMWENELEEVIRNEDWEGIFKSQGMEIIPEEEYYVEVLYRRIKDSDDYQTWYYLEAEEIFVALQISDVSIQRMETMETKEGETIDFGLLENFKI